MLKWNEHFYVGEGIRDSEKIRARLDENKLTPGVYLLTLSNSPGNLLEILPAVSLKQNAARSLCPEIFGMADSKDEAIDLACRILKEVYEATGAFNIEDYLKNR
ncbi:MAG: hypothetical protein Q4C77_00240 [Eubacteriales bacterium]|nr:hypothetical protein [Eubacteriales bacterium]